MAYTLRDLSQDERVALLAASHQGWSGWGGHLEDIARYVYRYAPKSAVGGPMPFGRARLRKALLSLEAKNLVVRHGGQLRFSMHVEGRAIVEEYRERTRDA